MRKPANYRKVLLHKDEFCVLAGDRLKLLFRIGIELVSLSGTTKNPWGEAGSEYIISHSRE
jgi:hypothetical protein